MIMFAILLVVCLVCFIMCHETKIDNEIEKANKEKTDLGKFTRY